MARINVVAMMLFSYLACSQELMLKKGESRIFNTTSNITTVFTSDPKVLDYSIVSVNKLIVFGVNDGYADLRVFGGSKSDMLLNLKVTVDPLAGELDRIAELIMSKNPGVKLKIDRLAEPGSRGYVLTGSVPDEGTRDHVYNMAAVALGLSVTTKTQDFQGAQEATPGSGGSSSNNSEELDFLEKVKSENLIDKLKLPPNNQVNVKLLVADVDKELIEQLGLTFNGTGVFTFSDIANNGAVRIASIVPVLRAVNNEKVAKILAQPNLSVLSGEEASFAITNQYTTFEEMPNNGISGGPPAIGRGTTVNPGVTLKIAPKVDSENKIKIKISQNVSNIYRNDQRGETTIADLRDRSTETTIELADGDSFMLAGLTDEREIENIQSVPFLGSIPFIGALFRSTSITKAKSELIIVATVELTRPIKSGGHIDYPVTTSRSVGETLINASFDGVSNTEMRRELESFINRTGFVR